MKEATGSVLVADDELNIRETLADRLQALGCQVATAADGPEALELIQRDEPDVVLLDLQMPRLDGMEVLRRLAAEDLDPTVVVITAYGSIERAVEAMKAGAYDFIPKPFEPEHIRAVVTKALERARLRREIAYWREQDGESAPLLTSAAPAMRQAIDMAYTAADSDATILLLGETGTGKEVLARDMHRRSGRRHRPFVAVNCVALAEGLLESELFGHEKGAFTGAGRMRKGRFERARGGTALLDEIGATQLDFQGKLLRILQEGTFERVGGEQELRTDVRIIAATNRSLEAAMSAGTFLPDLYYRLNVVSIRVPSLRERREDVPDLARFFLTRLAREAKREVTEVSEAALACMAAYDWPGNVRELENAIERAVVLGKDSEIGPDDLPEHLVARAADSGAQTKAGYHGAVADAKREILRKALRQTDGNRSKAADLLGLQRTYFSRLMKTLGLR